MLRPILRRLEPAKTTALILYAMGPLGVEPEQDVPARFLRSLRGRATCRVRIRGLSTFGDRLVRARYAALTVFSLKVGPPGFEPGLSAPKAERIPGYPTVPHQ